MELPNLAYLTLRKAESWGKAAPGHYRGGEGPCRTNNANDMTLQTLYQALLMQGNQAGYGRNNGLQWPSPEGFWPIAT